MIGAPVVAHAVGLPIIPGGIIPGGGCPGGSLDPVCTLGGAAASGIAAAGAAAVLSSVTGWVVSGATWLLGRIGDALAATTAIDVGASWFRAHFSLMVAVAGVVVLPLLFVSVIQAVYRQSAALLLRSLFVNLPLAVLLTFAALQLVQMGVKVTDALSQLVASGSGTDLQHVLSGVSAALTSASASSGAPAFVLLLGALVVVFGALAVFIELLVRATAVYVAVLFLPLALASLVWPAIAHSARRLVEVLVALILSKFVMVSILCLAIGALGSGSGFSTVLAGAALLLLAAFSPVALLRLVPLAQFGAVEHLDSVRHRAGQAVRSAPRTALTASSLAAQLGAGSLESALVRAGPVGSTAMAGESGVTGVTGAPSPDGRHPTSPSTGGTPDGGVGAWPGDVTSGARLAAAFDGLAGSGRTGSGRGGGRYDGPVPVIGAAGGVPEDDARSRAVIDHDDLGPTIRFVLPGDGDDDGHRRPAERPVREPSPPG